jgi:acyl-CoA thioesterase-1
MFKKLVLCVICWMALAAEAQPVLLVYGDSLSAGYGLPQGKGWVDLLARRLAAEGFDYRVINASVSGETTLGGANRIDAAMTQHQPAIVIIELGGNDGLRGLPLAATRQNIEKMVKTARSKRAQPLLVGMQLPPNYGTAYTEKFQALFAQIAQEQKVPLVPFMLAGFGEKREYFQPDGIHPTVEAQTLILDNIWPVLRPMLGKSK